MSQISHCNIKRLIEMSHVPEVAVELQEDQCLCIFWVEDDSGGQI